MNYVQHFLVSGLAMTMLVNAKAPLTGQWGGDRANLTIDTKSGQIEMDCAHGTFTAPLKLDQAGQFTAKGTFVTERGGPQHMNAPDLRRAATYSGKLAGSTLTLTIKIDGETTTKKLRLIKNAQVKLLRCL